MKLLFTFRVSLRGVACLSLLGLGAGCSEIDVAEQDVALRYFEEGDRIELQIDYRGIVGTPSRWGKSEAEVVPKAKERVELMAAGARHFYLALSPFPVVLDLEQLLENEVDWMSEEQRERIQKLMWASVSVESAKAFLDDLGEVALTQQVEIKSATACVAALNELVTLGVRDELINNASDPVDPTEVYGTKESRDNLRAFVDAGGTWVSLDQRALVVCVPMTPFDLALTLKELLVDMEADQGGSADGWAAGRGRAGASALFSKLEGLSVKEGVVTLRFPVGEDGRIHWNFRMPRHPDAKKLVAAFDADKLK